MAAGGITVDGYRGVIAGEVGACGPRQAMHVATADAAASPAPPARVRALVANVGA